MDQAQIDALTDGGQDYIYREGQWTTTAGYCVSTTHSHALTMKFYERHGRSPSSAPRVTPAENAKAARVKTARLRAAVAKVTKIKPAKSPRGRTKATANLT